MIARRRGYCIVLLFHRGTVVLLVAMHEQYKYTGHTLCIVCCSRLAVTILDPVVIHSLPNN